MNYKKIYNQLCSINHNEGYGEVHHIIPTCMGGSNDKSNLVRLSAKGHYIAHWLLVKIYPSNRKLQFAFKIMNHKNSNQTNRYKSAIGYESARKIHSKNMSGKGNPMYGIKLKGSKNPNFGKKGILSPNFGKKRSDETRKRISEAKMGMKNSEEHIANMSKAKKNDPRYKGAEHPMAKVANIYEYKTNKIIAENININVWCKDKIYCPINLRSTATGKRKHHRNLYAKYK